MRRKIVLDTALRTRARLGALVAQMHQLADQGVYLLLLANDDLVEFVEQVFLKADLDFHFGQAALDGVFLMHVTIGPQIAVPDCTGFGISLR